MFYKRANKSRHLKVHNWNNWPQSTIISISMVVGFRNLEFASKQMKTTSL